MVRKLWLRWVGSGLGLRTPRTKGTLGRFSQAFVISGVGYAGTGRNACATEKQNSREANPRELKFQATSQAGYTTKQPVRPSLNAERAAAAAGALHVGVVELEP
jgi:hypothetical protein